MRRTIWIEGAPLKLASCQKKKKIPRDVAAGVGQTFSKGKVQITWPLDKSHTFSYGKLYMLYNIYSYTILLVGQSYCRGLLTCSRSGNATIIYYKICYLR